MLSGKHITSPASPHHADGRSSFLTPPGGAALPDLEAAVTTGEQPSKWYNKIFHWSKKGHDLDAVTEESPSNLDSSTHSLATNMQQAVEHASSSSHQAIAHHADDRDVPRSYAP